MPKRILTWGKASPASNAFDLRQGVSPAAVANFNQLSDTPTAVAVAPSNNWMVKGKAGSSEQVTIYSGVSLSEPNVISLSGYAVVNCCAVNDNFTVVGANIAPYLMVFSTSTGTPVSVPATGLGTVTSADLSPDGQWLIINHDSPPYMRVYKVGAWTYRDYYTNGSPGSSVVMTGDNNVLLQVGGYFIQYQVTDTVFNEVRRHIGLNNKAILRHPGSPSKAIFLGDAASGVAEYDCLTGVRTEYEAAAKYNYVGGVILGHTVYAMHALADGRRVTLLDIGTRTVGPTQYPEMSVGYSGDAGIAGFVSGEYTITGTVRDVDNYAAKRTVRAHRRADGQLVAETASSVATGDYKIELYSPDLVDLQFLALDSEPRNDLFFARVTPLAE